jgi:hypothetical protein
MTYERTATEAEVEPPKQEQVVRVAEKLTAESMGDRIIWSVFAGINWKLT